MSAEKTYDIARNLYTISNFKEIAATSLEYQAMVLFFLKIFFRKRAAAFVLSVIFFYTCYRMILSDRDASLIVTKINIGSKKVKTNQIQVHDIDIDDNKEVSFNNNLQSKKAKSTKKYNINRYVQIN